MSQTPAYTRWQAAIDKLLVIVLVFLVYAPVLTHRYGYMDDFWMYFHNDAMKTPYFSAGRPIVGLVWLQIHRSIMNVGQLAALRLFAIVGVCVIACQIYSLTRHIAKTHTSRVALAVSVTALPSMTVLVAWATCWLYPFAAVFGLGSAAVAHSSIRLWQRQGSGVAIRLAFSTGLLLIGFGIYQPGSSWYWIVPFINVLDRRFMTNVRHRTRVLFSFAIGIIQFAIGYVTFKLYFALSEIIPQNRGALIHEPLAKIVSLFRIQLPLVLSQWQVLDTARKPLMIAIAATTAAIILCACLVLMGERSRTSANARRSQTKWAVWWFMLIATATMSHVHWLVLNYNAKNYRTAGALAACVTVVIWWSVWRLVPLLFKPRWQTRMATSLCLALALFALTKCSANLHRYWIHPYVTAYKFTVDELMANVSPAIDHIHMIRQSPEEGIVVERNIYNFGRPFSDFDWAIEGLVRAALADTRKDTDVGTITHGLSDDFIPQGTEVAVIDMRVLVQFRE